jgi:hypothetical protein
MSFQKKADYNVLGWMVAHGLDVAVWDRCDYRRAAAGT